MGHRRALTPAWVHPLGGECGAVDPFRALGRVLIRDSKDTTRPGLAVGRADWARFVRYVTEAV
ncbi:hypothetical protein GCM10022420_061760 [Streptomyces iranensis]